MVLLQLVKEYRKAYESRTPSRSFNREWGKVNEARELFFHAIEKLDIQQLKSYFNEYDDHYSIDGLKLSEVEHYNFLEAYRKKLIARIEELQPKSSEYSISLQDDELLIRLKANPQIGSADLGRYIVLIWEFEETREYYKTKENLCIRLDISYKVFKNRVKTQYEKDVKNLTDKYWETLEQIINIETNPAIRKKANLKHSELEP